MKCAGKLTRMGTGLAGVLALTALMARAETLRDPTAIPRAPASAVAHGGSGGMGVRELPLALLVADGKPFVMFDSRLFTVGDKLGSARIERITESEIWLREGKESRKISLYPGVQRLPHVPVKD